jgi:uncharacterized membrane protein
MRNRNVGFLVIGISLLILIIIFLFNSGMEDIIANSCDHGPTCSMHDVVDFQKNFSFAIVGVVFIIGLVLIFSKESERVIEKVVVKKVKEKPKKIDLSKLSSEEKRAVKILQRENGAFFQSSLMEELECGKVKMTRLIDKLESKGIVERKRRGMNNIIVLVK